MLIKSLDVLQGFYFSLFESYLCDRFFWAFCRFFFIFVFSVTDRWKGSEPPISVQEATTRPAQSSVNVGKSQHLIVNFRVYQIS